jgi:hypothetical protein
MQAHYKMTVASTMGVDPTASVHFGHPHKKAAAAAKHVDAPAKGKAAHGKKNTAAPHKPTAREEAAAEEAAHAKIDSEVWPSHKEQKWHQETSADELSHLASVAVNSMPAEKKVKSHAETAAQMQAEHKKETDATFPKRYSSLFCCELLCSFCSPCSSSLYVTLNFRKTSTPITISRIALFPMAICDARMIHVLRFSLLTSRQDRTSQDHGVLWHFHAQKKSP